MRVFLSIIPAAAALLLVAPSAEAQDASLELVEQRVFREAAALADASVVRVETVGGRDRVGRMTTATGPTTGIVVGEDGYIISSAFNFASNPASILVRLRDGRRFPATLVASDRLRMLALLKIETDGLIPIEPVPRDEIRVGQWSIALGRTYDLATPSVSVGIISALNRVWGRAVQTDARVSPVNYGGPLIDVTGRALGMVVPLSPKSTDETAGVEWYDSGIGFAIPMEEIYRLLDRLKLGEDLRKGLAGVNLKSDSLYSSEVTIDRVRYGSPAADAGLKAGDRIIEIDGKPARSQIQVQSALGGKYAGERLSITVERAGKPSAHDVELAGEIPPWESGFLGVLPKRSATEEPGVEVRYVYAGSPAEQAGISIGDRIVAANSTALADAIELKDVISRLRPAERLALEFEAEGEQETAEVTLDAIPATVPLDLPLAANWALMAELPEPADNAGPPADMDAGGETQLQTGRFSHNLEQHKREFRMYVPEPYAPGERYALMVFVHPDGNAMEAKLMAHWQTICDLRGIIILAPKASRRWKPSDIPYVRDAIRWVTDNYSIDTDRLVMHAFDSGAPLVWDMAFRERELVRGVLIAGAPLRLRSGNLENRPDQRLQVHLMCGEKNPVFGDVRKTERLLQRLKFPVSFAKSLNQAKEYPDEDAIEEAGRWIDSLDRI